MEYYSAFKKDKILRREEEGEMNQRSRTDMYTLQYAK